EYEVVQDPDVTGRLRAIQEVNAHRGQSVLKALVEAARSDAFWAARQSAIRALAEFKSPEAEKALLETLNDKDSRVRQASVEGLSRYKDARLVDTFANLIKTDPSYFVVSESAHALGQSGDARAYQILMDTMGRDSWAETIRVGALRGLAGLKDPRSLETALKYARPGNPASVRGAAFMVLAQSGRGNEEAFNILIAALKDPSEQVAFNALQALGGLGDRRAIPALEELSKRSDMPGFAKNLIASVISRLKKGGE